MQHHRNNNKNKTSGGKKERGPENLPNQIKPVSFVTAGAINEMIGVPKKAISNADFSCPLGRLERNDGTMNNHQNQYPNTWIETSLFNCCCGRDRCCQYYDWNC